MASPPAPAPTTTTFSSAHMRSRDLLIQEKHSKELSTLQRKIDKLRWTNDDSMKQLFDMQARALRLAKCLGFNDVADVQVFVDMAQCDDEVLSLRTCFEQVGGLKLKLEKAEEEVGDLKERITVVDKEKEELKAELDAKKSSEATLKLELSELQKQFDGLRNTYERATERYKADYKKWRKFNAWLWDDAETKGGSASQKQRSASVVRKKRKWQEMQGDTTSISKDEDQPPPPTGEINNPFLDDEDNESTPVPSPKMFNIKPPQTRSSPISPTTTKVDSSPPRRQTDAAMPLRSPSVFLPTVNSRTTTTTRGSMTFNPVPVALRRMKQQSNPTPSRHGNDKENTKDVSPSSETEEDTQALDVQLLAPVFKVPKVPRALHSSDTEPDTQSSSPLQTTVPLPTPKSIARPLLVKPAKKTDACDRAEPPHKYRRVDATQTPKAGLRHGRSVPSSSRRGKDKENVVPSTPAGGSTPLGDYSGFKGRGRYAKEEAGPKTINSIYTVDSSRNGGVEFPYDEVVRRKEDRKKMEAADCECCHEYYTAVGPLPPRMQPPLWRSPPKTEVKKRLTNCTSHKRRASDTAMLANSSSSTFDKLDDESQFGLDTDNGRRHRQIEDHKKAISRHRHHWARARTPPGYWEIGFPDTQEAAKINEEAKEMHRKKRVEVEMSVMRGEGRYLRR